MNDKVTKLSAALMQLITTIVGVLALFGVNIPQDKLNAIGASIPQVLGALMIISSLLPSLILSFKDFFTQTEKAIVDPAPPSQSGRAYPWTLLALATVTVALGALLTTGCTNLTAPKGLTQELAYVEGGSTAAWQTLTTLVTTKQVSVDRAKALQADLEKLDAATALSHTFSASGNLSQAQAQLSLAQTLLTQLQSSLQAAATQPGATK